MRAVVLYVVNAAALDGLQARDGLQQLLLSAAGYARDAEYLAGVRREADVVELHDAVDTAHGEVFHLYTGLRVDRVGAGDVERHRVPDHHVRHLLGVRVLCRHVADELPMAEYGDAVGKRLDLVHLVRDDDDSLARIAHIAQHSKELVRLLRGQHGGRLVEDEDVRAAVERLDDLHGLLLGDGHIVYLLPGVDLKAVEGAYLLNAAAGALKVETTGFFQTKHDVLRGGEHVHELEMLVYHAYAEIERVLRGAYHDLFPVDEYLPLVGEVNAGEHIHQRRLAAAVLAEQREDLSPVNVQPYLVVCHDLAERLCDVAHLHGGYLIVQTLSLL